MTFVGGRIKVLTQEKATRHSSEFIQFAPGLEFACPACGSAPENRGIEGGEQQNRRRGVCFCLVARTTVLVEGLPPHRSTRCAPSGSAAGSDGLHEDGRPRGSAKAIARVDARRGASPEP